MPAETTTRSIKGRPAEVEPGSASGRPPTRYSRGTAIGLLLTTTTFTPWRSATRYTSCFTGQASASTKMVMGLFCSVGVHRCGNQRDHVVLDVVGELRVTAQIGQQARRRQSAAFFCERLGVKADRPRRVSQRFVEIVAG